MTIRGYDNIKAFVNAKAQDERYAEAINDSLFNCNAAEEHCGAVYLDAGEFEGEFAVEQNKLERYIAEYQDNVALEELS